MASTATEDTIITRTPDEVAEALATQKATVEAIIIRAANRVEDLIQKRVGLEPYGNIEGIRTYGSTEEFLQSLDDDMEHEVPC